MSAQTQSESTAVATVTGATGGTLLLALIDLIPDENIYKQFFILLSPTATVTLRYIYLLIQRRFTSSISTWEAREEFNAFHSEVEVVLQTENISEKHRQDLTKRLEEARLAYFDNRAKQIKSKKK